MNEEYTPLQNLLNAEASLANQRYDIHQKIIEMRGNEPPVCWGQDDCSTSILSVCPWRIDCGDKTYD
jgi:hypothetical protein